MTDAVAHALYPLARGSDTPATVSMHGGGSGTNIAAWLAVDGNDVAFVGRRGASPRCVAERVPLRLFWLLGRAAVVTRRQLGRL